MQCARKRVRWEEHSINKEQRSFSSFSSLFSILRMVVLYHICLVVVVVIIITIFTIYSTLHTLFSVLCSLHSVLRIPFAGFHTESTIYYTQSTIDYKRIDPCFPISLWNETIFLAPCSLAPCCALTNSLYNKITQYIFS